MAELQLDAGRIARAREHARHISRNVYDDMRAFTTTTVERATLRLMEVAETHARGRLRGPELLGVLAHAPRPRAPANTSLASVHCGPRASPRWAKRGRHGCT